MAKISIILPIYNVAPYLEECFRSLANQTFRDAEYILIDDGSTDYSGAICDQWSRKDSRFVVVHKENGGVSSARNLGLQISKGEYIGFADGDDWLEPNALELLNSLLDEHPEADIACAGFYEYVSAPDHPAKVRPDAPEIVLGVTDKVTSIRNLLVRQGYWATLWNKLFRRSCLECQGQIQLFDTALHHGEDENWVLRAMIRTEQCVFSPVPIYHYRSRPTSISHQPELTAKVLSILDAYTKSVELLRPLSAELELLAYGRKYNDTFVMQVRAYCNGQRNMLPMIRRKMKGTWWYWLRSPYVLLLRKAKVIAVRTMMALQLPSSWVRFAFDIKRNQKEADL